VKKEIGEKKKHRKEYLYAVAVLGVVGLLFAMATGVPIGAQVAVPALSSVAYFFDGGHNLNNPMMVYYIVVEHKSAWDAFVQTAFDLSLAWLLDYIGVEVFTGVSDVVLTSASLLGRYLATIFIEYLPWWLGPVAVGYAAAFAGL